MTPRSPSTIDPDQRRRPAATTTTSSRSRALDAPDDGPRQIPKYLLVSWSHPASCLCSCPDQSNRIWNDVRRAQTPPRPIGRRSFLTGLGAAGAVALTGCSVFGGSAPTVTSVVEAPPPVDPILTLIATTRLHLARMDAALAALAADPAAVALLTPLRADRAAHLEALRAEDARAAGSVLAETTDPSASAPAHGHARGVRGSGPPSDTIRTDAETAQLQFSDGVVATGRYRAALFASISACLATHRSVLIPR